MLAIRRFSARIEGRTILKDVSLELGPRGVHALMGPGGSGKSSLLGILSGRNRAGTGWSLRGDIVYCGAPLGSQARPVSVGQRIAQPAVSLRRYLIEYLDYHDSAGDSERMVALLRHCQLDRLAGQLDGVLGSGALRLSAGEWWRLAIARELLADPPLVCVDEPTAGLSDSEAMPVLALLRAEGRRRCVLLVSHHQQHVRECSDLVILLAAGQVQEALPTREFFEHPRSKAAQDYVRTGGCYVPSPDARAEDLELSFQSGAEPEGTPTGAGSAQDAASGSALAVALSAPPGSPPPVAEPIEAGPRGAPQPPPLVPAPTLAPEHESGAPDSRVLWANATPVLRLRGFGVQFGSHSVISGLDLDIAERGIHLLVTPEGTQKRMLLRALCGPFPSQLRCAGQALYQGAALSDGNAPALAAPEMRMMNLSAFAYLAGRLPTGGPLAREEQREQAAKLVRAAGLPELAHRLEPAVSRLELAEWRALDVLCAASTSPALLCLDEPLSRLSVSEQDCLLGMLRKLATQRALLILAQDPAPFLRSGEPLAVGCWSGGALSAGPPQPAHEPAAPAVSGVPQSPAVPARGPGQSAAGEAGRGPPDSAPAGAAEPAEPAAPQPEQESPSQSSVGRTGPRGFQWLRERALAGMPLPGMSADLEYDLDLIRGAGVTHLVTLTTTPLPAEVLRQHGLQGLFFPIEDMDAPSVEAASSLCDQITELLAAGQVVGFHCKAGYGRTGTMLASQLIWEGVDAKTALAQVRAVDPNWVQSTQQERFLVTLADRRRSNRPPGPGTSTRKAGGPVEQPKLSRDPRTDSTPKRGDTQNAGT